MGHRKRHVRSACSLEGPRSQQGYARASRNSFSDPSLITLIQDWMACRLTILAIDLRDEIAFWIRQDHGAYGLVVFDVTGAAAQVTVERLATARARANRVGST